MKEYVFHSDSGKCWIIESKNKHIAIASAVEAGFAEDMADFYYGLEDGQIQVFEVGKKIPASVGVS